MFSPGAARATRMQVSAFHSVNPNDPYYHNNNECAAGEMIPLHDLAPGTGGKMLCATCSQLNHEQERAGE